MSLEFCFSQNLVCNFTRIKFLILHHSHLIQSNVLKITSVDLFVFCKYCVLFVWQTFPDVVVSRIKSSPSIKEFFIEKSCRYFHSSNIQSDSLPAFKMKTPVQLGHNIFRRYDICCLINFFISLERLLQVSFRFKMIWIHIRDKVKLSSFYILL